MDLRAFFSTFGLVLLAELGDKTQLATMTMSATSGRKWLVFGASSLALVLSSLIAVLAGDLVRGKLNPIILERAAGGLFVVMGAWMLIASFTSKS